MGELFNLSNNTFLQNLIFLIVLAILVSIVIIVLYIVLKRLIGNRDVKIGDWVKIEGKENESDKQVPREDVVILNKKELGRRLVKIKNELAEMHTREKSESIKDTVDAVINFQEMLYLITNRISEIYEGLLLMSKNNVVEIFMDQELMGDFNQFRNLLVNARIYTVKRMASIICDNIEQNKPLRDKEINELPLKTLLDYINSKYKSVLVSKKEFVDKVKDISPSIQATVNAKYKEDFVYQTTKKELEKEEKFAMLIKKLFSEIYRARPN